MTYSTKLHIMAPKSQQLQIRVTSAQKAALRRYAREAGLDVSAYVLARALPARDEKFVTLLRTLAGDDDQSFVLAELNDFLAELAPLEFEAAVRHAPRENLSAWQCNYVAAMVEQAAALKHLSPPAWTGGIAPLDEPWFATPLRSVRLHLLTASPVPFKRRNLFVDASVGARV